MTLPGWDNIDAVSRLVKFFTIAGFASLFLLGVFEVLGYLYSNRKDDLIHAEQVRIQTEQANAAEARNRQQEQAEQQSQAAIAQALERQKEAEKKLGALEEKQAPRTLTSAQKSGLSGYLSKHPRGRITIKSSINTTDARAYSEQIAAILTQSGWTVQIDNAIFTGTDINGIWITFKTNNAVPAAAGTIYEAFKSAGMPIRAQYDPAIPTEQELWLSVGAK